MSTQTALRSIRATRSIPNNLRAATTAAPSQPAQSAESASTPTKLPLSWPEYFSLRRQRRLWSTAASVPTTALGLIGGGGYFGSLEADPTQLIMGVEPIYVYGGATFACMGWLLGPTVGSALFSATHPAVSRGNPSPLQAMDTEFFEHVKRHRADPRFQSVNNMIPDGYAEKVTSLSTYRRWLRDQATYMRKAKHGVPDELL